MNATVRDVMTSPATAITPHTGLKQAAAMLRAGGLSALPVVDLDGDLVGVLSEADLLVKAEGPAPRATGSYAGREREARWSGTLACHLMSRPAVTVGVDDPLAAAARLMLQHGLKRLPVVDGADRPVGVVSRGDLLTVFLRTDEEVRSDVRARLGSEGLPEIIVCVDDGVVTLRGIPDEAAAPRATSVADGVDGVVAVRRSPLSSPGEGPGGAPR
jgi:CBS domain-containing protein